MIVPVLPLQKMLLAHIVYNKPPQSWRLEQDPSSDPNPCFSPSTVHYKMPQSFNVFLTGLYDSIFSQIGSRQLLG